MFIYLFLSFPGCLNGGAQIRPVTGESGRELVLQLEAMYAQLPQAVPSDNKLARKLYSDWLDGRDSDKAKAVLHTSYHAVEKSDIALNIKWWTNCEYFVSVNYFGYKVMRRLSEVESVFNFLQVFLKDTINIVRSVYFLNSFANSEVLR